MGLKEVEDEIKEFKGATAKEILTEEERKNLLKESYLSIKQVLSEWIDMKEEDKTIIALWIIGTWIHKQFSAFPYLFFNAPKSTAKTRTLKLIAALENGGEVIASPTEAVIFRKNTPLGIDECEDIAGKEKHLLRELLNAGYKRGIKVQRAKKVKGKEGEEQIIEDFELYRPIHLANISGMDDVLEDRCIPIIIEKTNNPTFSLLIEDFDYNPSISLIKQELGKVGVGWCSVGMPLEVTREWNNYIKDSFSLPTHTYIHTLHTYTYTNLHTQILGSKINGRHLELFFPLFIIASMIGEEVLSEIIKIASSRFEEKKVEEVIENKDIALLNFIASMENPEFEWIRIKEITNLFKIYISENLENTEEWLNNEWVGKALRRLSLILKKRRITKGIEVILNIEKAKEKIKIFS